MTPYNLVVLIGRMTADPEFQLMSNGKSKVKFTLAVRRGFKNSSGEYDSDFIGCEAFGQLAELICKYCQKGSELLVQGSWRSGSYKDKDGRTVYTNTVNVSSISFGSKDKEFKPHNSGGNTGSTAESGGIDLSGFEELDDNEPPF